jgi:hypothetical protein
MSTICIILNKKTELIELIGISALEQPFSGSDGKLLNTARMVSCVFLHLPRQYNEIVVWH